MKISKVSVIGLGYIGLPTAAVLASRRIPVIGIDVNDHAIETINRGEIHIEEPELDILVRAAVSDGLLRASRDCEPADVFMIAVPTPFKGEHEPDLSYIEAAANSIAPHLRSGNLVVLESTSPVGATEQLAAWLAAARPDLTFPATHGAESDIRVAHCPERVLPGRVLHEIVSNDRIIGGLTPRCAQEARGLYKLFVAGECILTDARTAELCKLTENSFRDVNIAFANELSLICDRLDINVWELIRLANRHPRVSILQPGPGVGGHCIAVDPWFIVSQAPEEAQMIATARRVNDAKPDWVIAQVRKAVDEVAAETGKQPGDVRIACLGLAFKPDIDDLRESPALSIAQALAQRHGDKLIVVEPHIKTLPAALANSGAKLVSLDAAIDAADVIVLLVDHKPFKAVETSQLRGRRVVDTRGVWAGR